MRFSGLAIASKLTEEATITFALKQVISTGKPIIQSSWLPATQYCGIQL
jgi:hypothetical protein